MTVSELMPVVYNELRRLARHYLAQERAPQTIQATALVHEAYLRLAKDKKQNWQGQTHFKAIAAIAMRRILVERARAKAAAKRGGHEPASRSTRTSSQMTTNPMRSSHWIAR